MVKTRLLPQECVKTEIFENLQIVHMILLWPVCCILGLA